MIRNKNFTRWLLLASALMLPLTLLFPVWKIELTAPQYPEGLVMKIWLHKLSGDINIINGLNRYIGMQTIRQEDFIEFKILPVSVLLLTIFGILAAVKNTRKWTLAYTITFILFGLTAIADFYRWEYEYGHNLDPSAPIQVPGLAYQPPLIGYKQLLNFEAFAIPDTAGWIFFGSVSLAILAWAIFWLREKREIVPVVIIACLLSMYAIGCGSGPAPVRWGQDSCVFCKMTLTDQRYGAQLVNQYGKAFLFDDIICLSGYLDAGNIRKENVRCIYFIDLATSEWIPAHETIIVKGKRYRSPMSSHLASFHYTTRNPEPAPDLILKFEDLFTGYQLSCK
jgi:copper chaperone NosL